MLRTCGIISLALLMHTMYGADAADANKGKWVETTKLTGNVLGYAVPFYKYSCAYIFRGCHDASRIKLEFNNQDISHSDQTLSQHGITLGNLPGLKVFFWEFENNTNEFEESYSSSDE